jgi:hypothetical protein
MQQSVAAVGCSSRLRLVVVVKPTLTHSNASAPPLLQPPRGQATTLRRNGSDFSATILGALFQSGQITIWTDVDGVYSADPRKVGGLDLAAV